MPLPILSFNQLVSNQQNTLSAASSVFTDFNPGSILQALIETNAANSLWIQALISALLAVTRLQTSSGNDVDTFVQQFGFIRPPASASTGVVTFTRTITTNTSYIPAATTIVSTSNGTPVQFTTVVDTTNAHYDAPSNSYILPINTSTISGIPIMCTQTGLVGNIGAGQINTIVSSLINVNAVTNPGALTNGQNTATDTQTKADFVLYLQGLSRATYLAIAFAVVNTPQYGNQVKRYQIVENKDTSGSTLYGFFFVVVDDGTGSPPSPLINAVKANIELYRGLSIMYDVIGPSVTTMTIVMQLTINQSMDTTLQNQVTANVKAALINYINTLPIGGVKVISNPPNTSGYLYYSELFDVILNADPNILSIANIAGVSTLTLNGGRVDIALDFKHVALTPTDGSDITITYTA
jgi:hypothetical protein